MPELEIWLADGSEFNFDLPFLQFNAKKKIFARISSRFELKYWMLNADNLNN